jgi:hypothetical protein
VSRKYSCRINRVLNRRRATPTCGRRYGRWEASTSAVRE